MNRSAILPIPARGVVCPDCGEELRLVCPTHGETRVTTVATLKRRPRTCFVCGDPVTYAGVGRPGTRCAKHPGRVSRAKRGAP